MESNAVIYARYSSHRQDEQSIEGQLHVCHDYAKRYGFTVVGEYIDRAISGRSDDRPQFQRMIDDSRKKAFQYVIVYKLDRFARNRYDSAIYKHKLKQNGVKLISAMENIGDNPESIILEAVLEASAEYYSLELAQKVRRGRIESASKGKFVGGGVPIGYKAEDGYLVLDEHMAPHIKWAFEQYADGVSKREIIDELNRRGLRNRKGKPFDHNAIHRCFRSEKYTGVLEQSGVRIEGGCPAIIDRDTFDRVQQRLDLMRRCGAKNGASPEVEYLLTGKVYCGLCGCSMHGVSGTGHTGNTWYYYQCTGRRKKRNGCKKRHEKKDFLEWYVVEQTVNYVLSPDRIGTIAAAVVAEYDREFGSDSVRQLEDRVSSLGREIEKYIDAVVDLPKSARPSLYEKIERLTDEKESLEIDLAKLRVANRIHLTVEEIAEWLRSFCKGDLFDMNFRRRIIDVLINSVFVFDDKILVYYNVKGGKQVSYIEMLESYGEDGCPGSDDDLPVEDSSTFAANGPPKRKHPFGCFSFWLEGDRIMSVQPGGLYVGQFKNWSTPLFSFREEKRECCDPLQVHQKRIAIFVKIAILFHANIC